MHICIIDSILDSIGNSWQLVADHSELVTYDMYVTKNGDRILTLSKNALSSRYYLGSYRNKVIVISSNFSFPLMVNLYKAKVKQIDGTSNKDDKTD